MFCQIYKTTVKNLFRSFIFLIVFLLLIGITVFSAKQGYSGKSGFGTIIYDTDPRFVLGFDEYISATLNVCKTFCMLYLMPIFAIVSTTIILAHNHGDEFFEIEKASGISPIKYTVGRLSAILSINFIITLFVVCIGTHFYVYTRGGVEYMGLWQYIGDSSVRILRLVMFLAMPSIIMYTGITYLVGTVFRNALSASIASIGYLIAYYILNFFFRNRFTPTYFDYFSPLPRKLTYYLSWYDTYTFEEFINRDDINTSFGKAAFCVLFLVAVGATGILISYLLTRKRDK